MFMKRIVLTVFTFLAGAMLFYTSPAHAEKTGVYVAPKFSVGFMNWQSSVDADASTSMSGGGMVMPWGKDSYGMDSGSTNTILGGNLAVGYDFYPRFNLPLRLELEYGIYGGGSSDGDSNIDTLKLTSHPLIPDSGQRIPGAKASYQIDIVNIQTLMANVWWDFRNSTAFTPYVGGGIGLSFIHAKGDMSLDLPNTPGTPYSGDLGGRTTTNFAWQLGAGCAWNITDTVALDLGYRFMSLGTARTAEETFNKRIIEEMGVSSDLAVTAQGKAKNIYMHQVGLGIRFTF